MRNPPTFPPGAQAVKGELLNQLSDALVDRTLFAGDGLLDHSHRKGIILRLDPATVQQNSPAPTVSASPLPLMSPASGSEASGSEASGSSSGSESLPPGFDPSDSSFSEDSSSGDGSFSEDSSSSSRSGSSSKTAIVWTGKTWVGLAMTEQPQAKFEDLLIVPLKRGLGAAVIDPIFRQCLQPGTLRVVSLLSQDRPAFLTAKWLAGALVITARDAGAGLPRRVAVRLEGIARGHRRRFRRFTAAQARQNASFYAKAHQG